MVTVLIKCCTLILLAMLVSRTTAANSNTSQNCEEYPSKVYVYQEEVFHHRSELDRCDSGRNGSKLDVRHSVGDVLLEYLYSGRSKQLVVTDSPNEADWFFVPFNNDRSADDHLMKCGQNHLRRLKTVVDALNKSPYFQRYKGADHLWHLGGWELTTAGIGKLHYFPFSREVLHNMSILRYSDRRLHLPKTQPADDNMDFLSEASSFYYGNEPPFEIVMNTKMYPAWWRQGQDHRCTVNVPVRSNPSIAKYHKTIAKEQTTLEDWEASRPFKFHFVGPGLDYPYIPGVKASVRALESAWARLSKLLPPQTIFSSDDKLSPDDFAESIVKSQFCIVLRGDDPSRSRFYDAISAGCIPVVISDGFRDFAAGYWKIMLNYDSFTISIPESQWLHHAPSALLWAVTMPRNELRAMHSALMNARPKLLYQVEDGYEGENSSEAVEYIFRALNERCRLSKDELKLYSKTQVHA